MQNKLKYIALTLFLIDALLLIINIEYSDPFASAIPDLDRAKICFYLGTISFIIFLKILKTEDGLNTVAWITVIFLIISMFFNLRLAKDNYDRIQCHKGISEYFQYFDSCSEMEKRFEADLINGEIKYFQNEYNLELGFEEKIRDKYSIELISISCTRFSAMYCYNDLVKDYIRKKNEQIIE